MAGTLEFGESFEAGPVSTSVSLINTGFNSTTGANAANFSTTHVASGRFSANFISSNTVGQFNNLTHTFAAGAQGKVYMRWAVYIQALPAVAMQIAGMTVSSGTAPQVFLNTAGTLSIYNSGAAVATTTNTITTGTFFVLEWSVSNTGSTQSLRLYTSLTGSPQETITNTYNQGTLTGISIGAYTNKSLTQWIDAVADAFDDWVGPLVAPGIAIDASSPATVTGNPGTGSLTTASFSPPANSLIVVTTACDNGTGTASVASITDSLGHGFGRYVQSNASSNGTAEVWGFYAVSAPGSITVTATYTNGFNNASGATLDVLVFTGASPIQVPTSATSTNPTISLTPTTIGSYIVGAYSNASVSITPAANASTTLLGSVNGGGGGFSLATFQSLTTISTLATGTYGLSNGGSGIEDIAAVEILPATGTNALYELTATEIFRAFRTSFSPHTSPPIGIPAGAMLVVTTGSEGNSTEVPTITITNSGTARTWTRIASNKGVAPSGDTGIIYVDYWYNGTGTFVSTTITTTFSVVSGDNLMVAQELELLYNVADPATMAPLLSTTATSTTLPQITATPTVVGSMILYHFAGQGSSLPTSSLAGTFYNANPDSMVYDTGEVFITGVMHQSVPNATTGSPVTIGSSTPSGTLLDSVAIEYYPLSSNIDPYVAAIGTFGTTSSGSAGTAPGVPSGVASGSLVVLCLEPFWSGATVAPTTASITLPSGFSWGLDGTGATTFYPFQPVTEPGWSVVAFAYKYATGADTGTYTSTYNSVSGTAVSAGWSAAMLIGGTNLPTSGSPFIDTMQTTNEHTGTVITAGSFTPSRGPVLLLAGVLGDGNPPMTPPASWVTQASVGTYSQPNIFSYTMHTAAATGSLTFTGASPTSDAGLAIVTIANSASYIFSTTIAWF